MTDDEDIKDLLDDDDIRNYFQSRDPARKKPIHFTDDEANTKGKATALTPKEDKEEAHGVSFTQHVKRTKETARHFTWIGISIGLFFAIILTLLI